MSIAAGVSAATALAGTALSAYGSIRQGEAGAEAARTRGAIAQRDAIIAQQNAEYATAVGARRAEDVSMRNAARLARVKASQAANGIDVNTGSAVDVQVSEREMGILDAETVMADATARAYGYEDTARTRRARGQMDDATSSEYLTAGYLGAGSTILSNIGRMPGLFAGGKGGGTVSGGSDMVNVYETAGA